MSATRGAPALAPLSLASAALLAGLAACGGGDAEHAHDPAHAADAPATHAHVAPHGGLLVALGDEVAHVELLLDAEAGELVAWLLDGEAERPLRSAQEALVLKLGAGSIRLAPVASALTGETAGDTSQFAARAPELVGARLDGGAIERVDVLGASFLDVPIAPEAR